MLCNIAVGSKLADNIDDDISHVKNSIAQLYSVMNIEQHQIENERKLIEKIDQLRVELEPFEKVSANYHSAAMVSFSELSVGFRLTFHTKIVVSFFFC